MWIIYQIVRTHRDICKKMRDDSPSPPDPAQPPEPISAAYDAELAEKPRQSAREIALDHAIGSVDPHQWNLSTKWLCTIIVSAISSIVAFATAISASLVTPIAADFGISEEVENLATGMFLFGFGYGSLFTGPFSETAGRWSVFMVTMTLMIVCLALCGSANTLARQIVFRWWAGFFGSSPLVCAGGMISDMWTPTERVFVFPIFAIFSYFGSVIAPVVGGAIALNNVSWRWGDWITIIASAVGLAMVFFLLPETFQPVLLEMKARVLSERELGVDVRGMMPVSTKKPSLIRQLWVGLYQPFFLTVQEPTVVLFTFYISLIYIILLTSLNGYTYIFGETYDFNVLETGLAFLGMLVGNCLVTFVIPFAKNYYNKDLKEAQEAAVDRNSKIYNESAKYSIEDVTPPPECQLRFAFIGAPFIPISLFWMAYTTRPDISPWSPLVASVLFGFGFTNVFISCYQYLASCYGIYTASALSAVNFLRAVTSGGMMMASMPMYKNIGVMWSLTILGIASALMVPVPIAFSYWGRRIRQKSKHASAAYGEEIDMYKGRVWSAYFNYRWRQGLTNEGDAERGLITPGYGEPWETRETRKGSKQRHKSILEEKKQRLKELEEAQKKLQKLQKQQKQQKQEEQERQEEQEKQEEEEKQEKQEEQEEQPAEEGQESGQSSAS